MNALLDPVLPGVAAALDVDAVRDELQDAVPECRGALRVEEVKIDHVQYKPRESCVILYAVKFRSTETGRSDSQLLSAVLLRDGSSPIPPPDDLVARYRASSDRLLKVPMVHLPRMGLVAYAFPLDPQMPSLVDVCDPDTMKRHLVSIWKGRGIRVKQVTLKPLGYTPGARAAVLYETLGEDEGPGAIVETTPIRVGRYPKLLADLGKRT